LKAKAILKKKGLTQRQLAGASGINVSLVNMILNERLKPSKTQRIKIARALQADERELFQ